MRTWRFADAAPRYDVVDENKFRRAIEQALQQVSNPTAGLGGSGSLEVDNAGAVVSYGVNDLNFSNEFVATVTQASPTVIVGVSLATTQPSAHTWSADQTFSSHVIIGTDPGSTDALRVGGNVHIVNGSGVNWGNPTAAHITGDGTPQLRFGGGGTDTMLLTGAALSPQAAAGLTLGTSALPWGLTYTGQHFTTDANVAQVEWQLAGVRKAGINLIAADTLRMYDSAGTVKVLFSLGGSVSPAINGGLSLGISTLTWSGAYFNVASALFWYNGATNNGYLQIDGTPSFNISLGGTLRANMTQSAFTPNVAGGLTLGTATLPWGASFFNALMTIQAGGLTITAGNVGNGTTPVTYIGEYVTGAILSGNVQQYGIVSQAMFGSGATTSGRAIQVGVVTAAAAFTMSEGTGLSIQDATLGAGSAITTQYGIFINSQTKGGTNYAIFTNTGQVSLGDSLYVRANATVGIGIAPVAFNALYISGVALSGGSPQAGVVSSPTFGSAATLAFPIFAQLITAAANFTLTQGMGVYISDATKGAGSTITTQYGLYVVSQTKGGTNYAVYTNAGQVALGDDLNFYTTATGVFDHTMTRFGGGAAPAVTNDVWSYDGPAAKWRPRFLQVEVKTGVLVAAANGDGTFSTFAFDGRTPAGTSVAGPTPTVTAIYGGFIVDMGTTPPSGFVWDIEWTNSANGNTGGPVRITSQEMVFQFFSNNSSVPFGTTATTFQFKVSQTGATAAVYGTASAALAASTRTEVNAYGLIVASQIACVNLAAISADLGICAAGVITDAIPTASQTKGIFIKSTAFETSVPAGWLTGIFFSGANPPPVTVTGPYIDFTATGTNLWLKGPSGNFTVDASGNVVVKGVLQVQLGASSTFAKVGGLLFDIGGYTQTATVISSTTTTTITSIAIGANAWNATGRGIRFTITGRFIQNAVGSQNTITVRLCYGGTTTAFNLFTSAGMGTLTTNQSFILVGMINVTNASGAWGQANALQSLGAPNGTGTVTGLNNSVGGSTSTGVTAATLYLVYDQTGGASNISVTFNMDSCVVEYV